MLAVDLKNKRSKETTELQLDDLVGLKGWKAVGNRFFALPITKIKELSGDEQEYEIRDKIDEHTLEVSDEKTETPEAVSVNESKTTAPEVLESEDPQAELAKKPDKEKQEESTDLKTVKEKEKEKQDETFHSGDTVEMKIDMDEVKKKRDQLDLFDD